MGYIYIIKNTVNNKVYIGQTINTIENRFKEHIIRSKHSNSKIYKAFKELGIENFYVEKLVKCDNSELNKYEQYYVEKYDSLNNGYNTVYPCSSNGIKPVHDYEDKVIDMYKGGYSFAKIAKECNISTNHANKIISEYKPTRNRNRNIQTTNDGKSKQNIMYDLEFNPIRTFESLNEAYIWLDKNTSFAVTKYGAYAFIDIAFTNGNIAYGHRWQLASDLVYEDKIFRTKFDKEAYIEGKPAYQPEGKNYWIVDGALDKVKTYHKKNTCIDCGKEINSRATRCLECENKLKQTNIKTNSLSKPDKSELSELLDIYNYTEIGKIYSVSANAVKKWAQNYGLYVNCYKKPSKEELIKLMNTLSKDNIAFRYEVSRDTVNRWIREYNIDNKTITIIKCVTDDINFNSFRDAARYLVDKGITTENSIRHIAYHISQVCNTDMKYCGKLWTKISNKK